MPEYPDRNHEVQPLSENQTTPGPIPNTRSWREWAAELNADYQSEVEGIIRRGQKLWEAKFELSKADFAYMLAKGLRFGQHNARLYMRVARNPVLVKRKWISILPASLTKLVELTKLPPGYLERLLERDKITPKIEIETIKKWVAEHEEARLNSGNFDVRCLWFIDFYFPQYEPTRAFVRHLDLQTADASTGENLAKIKDWFVKAHAEYVAWEEERRQRLAEDDRMRAREPEAARSDRANGRIRGLHRWRGRGRE